MRTILWVQIPSSQTEAHPLLETSLPACTLGASPGQWIESEDGNPKRGDSRLGFAWKKGSVIKMRGTRRKKKTGLQGSR